MRSCCDVPGIDTFQNTTEILVNRVEFFLEFRRGASPDGHVPEKHTFFEKHASGIPFFSSTASGIVSQGA